MITPHFQPVLHNEQNGTVPTLSSNLYLENKILQYEFEKPFLLVSKLNDDLKGIEDKKDRFEPLQTPINKGIYNNQMVANPTVYPGEDSNLRPTV